jgi:hypothetical protein
MVRAILVALVALGLGCQLVIGDIDRSYATDDFAMEGELQALESEECSGFWLIFGDVSGPCAMTGGGITAFGTESLLGGLGRVVDGALAFFGASPPAPVEITLTLPEAPVGEPGGEP